MRVSTDTKRANACSLICRSRDSWSAKKTTPSSIGKCDRCGTVVEPRLSEQWFIKIKPLADRAKEAVESGEITIVPDNYRQMYLNWMNNIHDWCVSRQLWWGHRIPAWTCDDCKDVIVAREAPTKCASAEARSWNRFPTFSTPGSLPDCCPSRL